jgi:hypothetical protein
MFGDKHDSV